MALLVDVLDGSRFIEVVKEDGKGSIVKVYWADKTGRKNYGGTTRVPTALLNNPRIGFVVPDNPSPKAA